ncbi:MAG TPA: polyprenyl synthetase family protein [Patescibacteria group bacterium]|nr:polyprenyl synthetase family protein [Patescibacteria group bacterium]
MAKTIEDFQQDLEFFLKEIASPQKPASMYEPFRYLLDGGGKRVRPLLVMMSTLACGGTPGLSLNAAAAMEILHNFTLVHDDIMDQSPLRRGRETVYKKWNESTAILLGDMMIGIAYRLLDKYNHHKNFGAIMSSFTRGLIEVCEGQAYDLDFRHIENITMQDYILMIEKKTAMLLEMSAEIGAQIAGASHKDCMALKTFARSMGIAFQIQDDLLDMTATGTDFGKVVGQDIVEGKKTYLIVRALEKATEPQDKALLKEFCIKGGLPQSHIVTMQDIFTRTGVYDDARAEVTRYTQEADSTLMQMPQNDGRDMLEQLLKMLAGRKN